MTFDETIKRVAAVNKSLYAKGFTHKEVRKFWDQMIKNSAAIEAAGIDNIKVCTGCGHLNIEPIDPPAMACCPDSNYINIQK
ncbi:MAG: hypothetical protein JJE55_07015 [Flavobacteriaceae bacterium]|nr:hypothetical protein [Flavobacteriaceae bacterium]